MLCFHEILILKNSYYKSFECCIISIRLKKFIKHFYFSSVLLQKLFLFLISLSNKHVQGCQTGFCNRLTNRLQSNRFKKRFGKIIYFQNFYIFVKNRLTGFFQTDFKGKPVILRDRKTTVHDRKTTVHDRKTNRPFQLK